MLASAPAGNGTWRCRKDTPTLYDALVLLGVKRVVLLRVFNLDEGRALGRGGGAGSALVAALENPGHVIGAPKMDP